MATQGKVASRYAKALFDQLKGSKNADSILEELEKFASAALGHKELAMLIASPGFSEAQKTGVVQDVAAKLKLSPSAQQILTGISRMGRVGQLGPILNRLRILLRQSEGVQPIQVLTADAIGPDDKKHIGDKFEKILGKKVEATYETSSSLVGGLKVVAGGRTYDGTLSGWLDSLKDRLVEGEA